MKNVQKTLKRQIERVEARTHFEAEKHPGLYTPKIKELESVLSYLEDAEDSLSSWIKKYTI